MDPRFFIMAGALLLSGIPAANARIPGTPHRRADIPTQRDAQRQQQQGQLSRPVVQCPYIVSAPPRLAVQASDKTETVDRLLGYTWTEKYGENTRTTNYTYAYDDYGFPLSRVSDAGNHRIDYAYTWVDPGKVWSKRTTTETLYENTYESVNERTFHSNGSVASILDNGTLSEYDENGYLTKTGYYGYDPQHDFHFTTYTHFPLLDIWLQGEESGYRTVTVTVEDLSYTIESKELINDVWYTTFKESYFYRHDGTQTGDYRENYNWTDGIPVKAYAYGWRSTRDGDTEINESWDDEAGEWQIQSTYTYSPNFDDPWTYNPGETRWNKYVWYSGGEPYEEETETYTWINPVIVKRTVTPSGRYDYSHVSDGELHLGDAYYNEDTGCYAYTEYDGTYDYYRYFLADGTLSLSLRYQWVDDAYVYERLEGGVWTPCRNETVTLYDDNDEDDDTRTELTFDAEGRLVAEREIDNTSDFTIELTEYAYNDGETREKWTDYDRDEETGQYYKDSEGESHRYADGSSMSFYFYYNPDGTISSASKYETGADHLVCKYIYAGDQWVTATRYAEDSNESFTDAQGRTGRIWIDRELDDDGNVCLVRKEVSIDSYDNADGYSLSERYWWQDGKWVGDFKRESWREQRPDFVAITPGEPTDILDEYFFPDNHEDAVSVNDGSVECRIEYRWNAETEAWELDYTNGCTFRIEGNTLYELDLTTGEVLGYTTVDAQRRILDKNGITLYEYDSEGRVVHKVEMRDREDGSWTYDYTYGAVTVISGIDEIRALAADPEVVATYTLSGVQLDPANAAPGIYIQRLADGTSRKVFVRP